MLSHRKSHQIIYVTSHLMDNFYVLSGILIKTCSFNVSCQLNEKPGTIDQLTLSDRPVDRDRLVGHPWSTLIAQTVISQVDEGLLIGSFRINLCFL